jgi:DNA-binding NarL/FixJ family response regulator
MSKSARKVFNSSEQSRLVFEHVDRRGRVSLLPLRGDTQRLFTASMTGSYTGQPVNDAGNDAGEKPVMSEVGAAAQSLTVRQWQVFDLLIAGLSSKQIAYELSISPRTVEIHRAQVMQKMGVRNAASLVRVALLAA